ncbi:unnamed protein product [Rhizoctonia solani]|uniref:Uncharacterized protein n=1 Tax=Rhizoctonia solani TaxID=456999 RepID=A0A8H3E7C6_9AGAM|nr:unnamed protein product [Rhizoctonia solani]
MTSNFHIQIHSLKQVSIIGCGSTRLRGHNGVGELVATSIVKERQSQLSVSERRPSRAQVGTVDVVCLDTALARSISMMTANEQGEQLQISG